MSPGAVSADPVVRGWCRGNAGRPRGKTDPGTPTGVLGGRIELFTEVLRFRPMLSVQEPRSASRVRTSVSSSASRLEARPASSPDPSRGPLTQAGVLVFFLQRWSPLIRCRGEDARAALALRPSRCRSSSLLDPVTMSTETKLDQCSHVARSTMMELQPHQRLTGRGHSRESWPRSAGSALPRGRRPASDGSADQTDRTSVGRARLRRCRTGSISRR